MKRVREQPKPNEDAECISLTAGIAYLFTCYVRRCYSTLPVLLPVLRLRLVMLDPEPSRVEETRS